MRNQQQTYLQANALYTLLKRSVLFIMLFSFLSACSNQEDIVSGSNTATTLDLRIKNTSYANLGSTDGDISQIKAMIFANQGGAYSYLYTADASNIQNIGNETTSFQITLQFDPRPLKIYFYTNADNAIAQATPQAGDSEDQILKKIQTTYTSAVITSNFPMWGVYLLPTGTVDITASSPVAAIKAIRTIARVDVSVADITTNFEMSSVQVFRANSLIQIAPTTVNSSNQVTAPSIPTASAMNINTDAITITSATTTPTLYLPESVSFTDHTQKATCIVVGGKYKGSTKSTYYRIDFDDKNNATTKGEILRNHHYTFNVKAINEEGWETPEEAANNRPANIAVEILDWVDLDSQVEIEDPEDYFGIENLTITVTGGAGDYHSTYLETTVPDYTVEWTDATGQLGGTPSSPLESDYFSIQIHPTYILAQAKLTNTSGVDKLAYVKVKAKRVEFVLKIVQKSL